MVPSRSGVFLFKKPTYYSHVLFNKEPVTRHNLLFSKGKLLDSSMKRQTCVIQTQECSCLFLCTCVAILATIRVHVGMERGACFGLSEGFKAIVSRRDLGVKQSSLHKHCRWHITLHTMRDLFPPSQLACNVIWWRYWFYFCTSLIFDIQLIASCRVAYSYVSRILSLYMTRLRVIYMTWCDYA